MAEFFKFFDLKSRVSCHPSTRSLSMSISVIFRLEPTSPTVLAESMSTTSDERNVMSGIPYLLTWRCRIPTSPDRHRFPRRPT